MSDQTERAPIAIDCNDSVPVPEMCELGVAELARTGDTRLIFNPLTRAEAAEIKAYMDRVHPTVKYTVSEHVIRRALLK